MLSVGVLYPFFQLITGGMVSNEKGLFYYFYLVVSRFPEEYLLLSTGILMICLIGLKNVFQIIKIGYGFHLINSIEKMWKSKIYKVYMCAKFQFVGNTRQGAMVNNLLHETTRASYAIEHLIESVYDFFMTISLFLLLLFTDWRITVIVSILGFIVVFPLRNIAYRFSLNSGKKRMKINQQLSSIATETLTSIKQIKIFSLENKVIQEFVEKARALAKLNVRFVVFNRIPYSLLEIFMITFMTSSILFVHYLLKIEVKALLPKIGLFAITFSKMIPLLSGLFSKFLAVVNDCPSLLLVNRLYDADYETETLDKGEKPGVLREDIVVNNIDFAYHNSNNLFSGLNMRFPLKKTTAIVGHSGSGKTTIIDLLCGFYFPQKGAIQINSKDIQNINLTDWRNQIGYVSQNAILFDRSVKDNLKIGNQNASEESIVNAAKMAYADGFIRKMDNGYNSLIKERGMNLSGGEQQRMAIARVLVSDPQLFLFDEATSALDMESEKYIQQSIESLKGTKTVIIVAHRLSTIRHADYIYVLEKGKVVEFGSFDDLIKQNGMFREMVNSNNFFIQ